MTLDVALCQDGLAGVRDVDALCERTGALAESRSSVTVGPYADVEVFGR
jgi:hypothetical protein